MGLINERLKGRVASSGNVALIATIDFPLVVVRVVDSTNAFDCL